MLVIGIGNMFRHDDGAGPSAASLVKAGAPPGVKVLIRSGDAADLMEVWAKEEYVFVIDAMKAGLTPGEFKRIDGRTPTFPVKDFQFSTHSMGLAEAIEIGRVLVRLPKNLIIYGIEVSDVGNGQGLTPVVEKAVSEVAARIIEEIKAIQAKQ